eukprot:9503775-Pyramimonas_sp.AAC.2
MPPPADRSSLTPPLADRLLTPLRCGNVARCLFPPPPQEVLQANARRGEEGCKKLSKCVPNATKAIHNMHNGSNLLAERRIAATDPPRGFNGQVTKATSTGSLRRQLGCGSNMTTRTPTYGRCPRGG